MGRVLPVVDEAGRDRLAQVGDPPEVGEVAAPVAGDDGVQRVVKVVAPLRVEAQAADVAGPDHARVVEIALGDQPGGPPLPRGLGVKRVGDLAQDRLRRFVVDSLDRVEAQPVDVVLAQPVQGVVDEEAPHLVAVGAVEVQRVAPRRVMAVGEVRAVVGEVVPLRPEVVVDDVEDQGEPVRVARVGEPLQAVGAAVGRVRRVQVDAVVAPVAIARERRHGHQLDGGDAEVAQVRQPRGDARERPLRRKRAHVQLVDDEIGARHAPPAGVAPRKPVGRDDARRRVHAARLVTRHRIGTGADVGQQERVVAAGRRDGRVRARREHAAVAAGHRQLGARRARRVEDPHRQRAPARRPDGEADRAVGADVRSALQPPGHAA